MSTIELSKRQRQPEGLDIESIARADGCRIISSDRRRPAAGSFGGARKLGISVCSGCLVGCVYCAANRRRFFRPLSAWEIVDQAVILESLSPEIKPEDFMETKISFKEMGDPLLNPENVLQAIDSLTAINPKFRFIVSTSAPRVDRSFYEALAERLKNSRIRLCFSCQTTSNLERAELSPKIQMLIFEEIAELARQWPGDPVTLDFIIIDGFTYDVGRLAEWFDPQRVFIKINHFDSNEFVRAAGLRDAPPEQVAEFKAALSAQGFRWAERLRP